MRTSRALACWSFLAAAATACNDPTFTPIDALPADSAAPPDTATDSAAPPDGTVTPPETAVAIGDTTAFAALSRTFTKVPYSVEDYDDAGEFDTATGRFTAAASGDYQICASLRAAGVPFELALFKNNTSDRALAVGNGTAGGCRSLRLVAGDYLEIFVFQTSDSTVTIPANDFWNWLTIRRQAISVEATASRAFAAPSWIFTTIPYDTEVRDEAMQFDPLAHRFTATAAGDFEFCASLALGGPAEIDLYVNATRENGFGFGTVAATGCRTLRLAAGSNVDVRMTQETGATISNPATPAWSGLTVLPRPLSVSIDGTSSFSVPSGVFTRVPYNGELFDDLGEFDVGSSTFTAAAAGDYRLCAMLDDRTSSLFEIDVFKNGAREKALAADAIGPIGGCRVLRLAANDQLDVRTYQMTGKTIPLISDGFWPALQISRIR